MPVGVLSEQSIEDRLIEYYLKGYIILILGPGIDLSHVEKFIGMLTIVPARIYLPSSNVSKVLVCKNSTGNEPTTCTVRYVSAVHSKDLADVTYMLPRCIIALAIVNVNGKTAVAEYEVVNVVTRRCVVPSREFIERYLLNDIINDAKKFIKKVKKEIEIRARPGTYFEIKKEGGTIIGFDKIAWYYVDPCGHVLGYAHLYVKLYYVAKDTSTGKSLFVIYAESVITDYNKDYECNGYMYGSVVFKNITIIRDALAEEYPGQYVGSSGPTKQADCPGGTLSYGFTLSEEPSFTITISHKYGGSSDYAVALKWVVSTPSCQECVLNEFVACKPEKYEGRTGYGDTLAEVIGYEPVHVKVTVDQWILYEAKPSWWPFGYNKYTAGPYKATCKLEMYHNKAIIDCKLKQ